MNLEMSRRLPFLLATLLSSCSLLEIDDATSPYRFKADTREEVQIVDLQSEELASVRVPIKKPVVAVYPLSFTDQTGQRKSNSSFALFSTAITQAPYIILMRALKHAGKDNGNFFTVIESVNLDSLSRERQLIRSTRNQFAEDGEETFLPPLLFAGLLVEGAVVSYDTNLVTGGAGARYLGVGSSKQYRQDSVSVSLRLVSVATGEILIEVSSSKTIWSTGISEDIFKFIEMGQELVEVEVGASTNESATIALSKAIEGGVLELINIGYDRGFWKYEDDEKSDTD